MAWSSNATRSTQPLLTKSCFLDTTQFPELGAIVVSAALANPTDHLGSLSPTIRGSVVNNVNQLLVPESDQLGAVLAGEHHAESDGQPITPTARRPTGTA